MMITVFYVIFMILYQLVRIYLFFTLKPSQREVDQSDEIRVFGSRHDKAYWSFREYRKRTQNY